MKILKTISLVVVTTAALVALYFAYPRHAGVSAAIRSIGDKSAVSPAADKPPQEPTGPVVVVSTTAPRKQNRSPEQLRWLENKRKRHELFRDALQPQTQTKN